MTGAVLWTAVVERPDHPGADLPALPVAGRISVVIA